MVVLRVSESADEAQETSDPEEEAPSSGRSTRPMRKSAPIDVVVSGGETSLDSDSDGSTAKIAPRPSATPPPPPIATPADAPLNLIPPDEEDPLGSATAAEPPAKPPEPPARVANRVSQWTDDAELRVIFDEARPAPLPEADD